MQSYHANWPHQASYAYPSAYYPPQDPSQYAWGYQQAPGQYGSTWQPQPYNAEYQWGSQGVQTHPPGDPTAPVGEMQTFGASQDASGNLRTNKHLQLQNGGGVVCI